MKALNKFLNIIIVLGCIVFGGAFYFLSQNKSSSKIHPKGSLGTDPQELANKYMQEVQKDLTVQNLNAQKSLTNVQKEDFASQGSVKETDPRTISVEQQIWRDPQAVESRKTIDQRLADKMQMVQVEKQQDTLDKQEYIRQFKENARKNGYEIKVNEDTLEVMEVKPIRNIQKNDYDSNRNSSDEEY